MCVIIDKKIGQEIPFESLLLAAGRNPDGYGVVIADRGENVVLQGLAEKSATAAENVARFLEQAKDLPCMVHFRFATAGARTVGNAHPFQILSKDKDGVDMHMMHNGTIHHFKIEGSQDSDTARFVNIVARPLLKRLWKSHGEDEVAFLGDPVLTETLKAMVGWGVLTFQTSNGGTLRINEVNGKDYDFGWASNKNPLDTYKVQKKKDDEPKFLPSVPWTPPSFMQSKEQKVMEDALLKRSLDVMTQGEDISKMIKASSATTSALPRPSTRLTATDFIKPYDLEDLIYLDMDDIRDMVHDCPEAAAVILMDLLHKFYVEKTIQKRVEAGAASNAN